MLADCLSDFCLAASGLAYSGPFAILSISSLNILLGVSELVLCCVPWIWLYKQICLDSFFSASVTRTISVACCSSKRLMLRWLELLSCLRWATVAAFSAILIVRLNGHHKRTRQKLTEQGKVRLFGITSMKVSPSFLPSDYQKLQRISYCRWVAFAFLGALSRLRL